MEDRIKIAVELLKDKKPFKVGDIGFGINELDEIVITGWSNYINLANITKPIALQELQEIKLLFYKMVDISPDLKEFIKARDIKFELCYDDSGKVGILICSEKNNIITWSLI